MKLQRRSWSRFRPFVVWVGTVLIVGFAGQLLAAPRAAEASANPASVEVVAAPNPYADASDEALTKFAARWDDLDADQRRALLAEVKMRMARQGSSGGVLRIRLQRRYGTIVRRGRATIRIKVRPVLKARQEFGVGFEQRTAQASPAQASKEQGSKEQAVPVIKVTDPN